MRELRHQRTSLRLLPAAALGLLFLLAMSPSCGSASKPSTGSGAGTGTGGVATTSSGSAAGGASANGGATGSAGPLTSASTSGATTTGTSSSGGSACASDKDCAGNPAGAVCDTTTGMCVGCTASDNPCGMGKYCDVMSKSCLLGCSSDADCANSTDGPHCNATMHACVACLSDNDCPAGETCAMGPQQCFPGCNPMKACPTNQVCCGSFCYDLENDANHCGSCMTSCPAPPNAQGACSKGQCGLTCNPGWADCDGNAANGCEWNVFQNGPCACTPGQMQPCYQGPPGTEGVGTCKGGAQTCNAAGTSWGPCVGQVLPQPEMCNSTQDLNCDGVIGDAPDIDGDGWTACNGDCCEIPSQCKGLNPALVNPGAFEIPGNGVDDNCDGIIDNPVTTVCSTANKLTGVTGTDVIKAMDICQFTTANPPLPMKIWGVISATQVHADGTAFAALTEAQNSQTAIKTKFGTGGVVPKMNGTMAVISSGMARDAADAGWVVPIPGTTFTSMIPFAPIPAGALGTYLNAHGGNLLPGQCNALPCPVGTGANDSINISLQIRVPTNAQGFSYNFRFYSAEYQTFQCTAFNDYYLAMLTSGAAGIPADHNISFDALNNAVSVNNGFFQDCGGNGQNCNTCPGGVGSLKGTGFDNVAVMGGSTEWLTTDSPALPGEVMTLELIVFDVSDQIYDTLVLLDNFRWDLTPVTLGTHL
jgi:hypothetical protein